MRVLEENLLSDQQKYQWCSSYTYRRTGSYFKSLSDDPANNTYVNPLTGFETDPVLDNMIVEEEVRAGIQSLKNNKAHAGLDGLPAITF